MSVRQLQANSGLTLASTDSSSWQAMFVMTTSEVSVQSTPSHGAVRGDSLVCWVPRSPARRRPAAAPGPPCCSRTRLTSRPTFTLSAACRSDAHVMVQRHTLSMSQNAATKPAMPSAVTARSRPRLACTHTKAAARKMAYATKCRQSMSVITSVQFSVGRSRWSMTNICTLVVSG
jgi:hypothetical protein